MFMHNGLMEENEATRKFNLSLPAGLLDELYRVTGAEKRGRKHHVLTAAVVMFLESGGAARDDALERVGAALATQRGMAKLVNEVKTKLRGNKGRVNDPMARSKASVVSYQE